MGPSPPSAVKVGEQPGQAFDQEHAALKDCSQRGSLSRRWYLKLRALYGGKPKS